MNRDGNPDRRFKDNRQLAIMKYDVLNISSSAGMRLKLQLSKSGLAEKTAKGLEIVQSNDRRAETRGACPWSRPRLRSGPEDADLPPLAGPVLKMAGAGVAALEYRWLAALPEWSCRWSGA